MSLINDALKRATQTQPAEPPATPPPVPMQPVAYPRHSHGLPVYFMPVLLAVICGGGFILWKGWESRREGTPTLQPLVVQARESNLAFPTEEASIEPGPVAIPAHRDFSVEDKDTTPAASTVVDAPPATPAFKLQGIFYRVKNPSAVINSKTVYVGDIISDAKIKSIDRQTVTLDRDGETSVLTLY